MTTTRSTDLASRALSPLRPPVYDLACKFLASAHYQNLAYPDTRGYANVLDSEPPQFSEKIDPKIASRPLPPRPDEILVPALDLEPIPAEISFPKSSSTTALRLSENTHGLSDLLEKLHRFLSKLEEILAKILESKEKSLFVPEKRYVKVAVATPLSEAEKVLARDEFLFKNTSQRDFELLKKRLEVLKGSLEAMQFVLTGIVNNASKVFYGEYGEQLGVGITKPLSEAQTKLVAVEKRLQEVIVFQSEQLSSTVPLENRYRFFNSISNRSNANEVVSVSERIYENRDVINEIPKAFIR